MQRTYGVTIATAKEKVAERGVDRRPAQYEASRQTWEAQEYSTDRLLGIMGGAFAKVSVRKAMPN